VQQKNLKIKDQGILVPHRAKVGHHASPAKHFKIVKANIKSIHSCNLFVRPRQNTLLRFHFTCRHSLESIYSILPPKDILGRAAQNLENREKKMQKIEQ
jgi:hypothetical protein